MKPSPKRQVFIEQLTAKHAVLAYVLLPDGDAYAVVWYELTPPLKPSPQMQHFIEQLAAKHSVDLSQSGASLRLTMPDRADCLLIDTDDGRHVSVARWFVDAYGPVEDPYILLRTDYPLGWAPLDLLYSASEWEAFAEATGPVADPDAVDLVTLTEYWAQLFAAQGWLERGRKDESGRFDAGL